MAQSYSLDKVSEHNTEKDLWMIMDGQVYDLTDFLSQHPGGEEVLMKLAGSDGTFCFDDIGHSNEAKQLRETFKIGRMADGYTADTAATSSTTKKNESATADDDDWVYEEPKKKSSPYLSMFLALGVLVYALIFYYVL